ncbi:MAG: hypothetical protein ACRD0P_21860, partial [Stackebrandtia sp.]
GMLIGIASVAALLLVASVLFMVMWISTKSDLDDANGKIDQAEEDKEAAENDAKDAKGCIELVEDLFDELDGAADPTEINGILSDMEDDCET